MIDIDQAVYLGDGLYAVFDGYGIQLLANSHTNPSDRVYLEPEVLNKFLQFHCEVEELILKYKEEENHE